MPPTPQIVVSGMGAVSAAGFGCAALRRSTIAGTTELRPWGRPSASFPACIPLGLAPGGADYLDTRASSRDDQARCIDLACSAAGEALAQAGFFDHASRSDIALVLGTNLGDQPAPLHELVADIADALGLRGPRLVVMLACASSTAALGVAHRLLAEGDAPAVVVGGSDLTTPLVLAGFRALGLLSPTPCVPFGPSVGTSLGEGAGFVVLEPEPRAHDRGVRPRFAVRGHGLAADAYHATRPHPGGQGLSQSLVSALRHAAVDRSEVTHINVHGTGTAANDTAEWRGLQRTFGEHAKTLWVSASKGMLGHAQGAAGILELITTLLAWEQGSIPVTHAVPGLRPGCEGMRVAVGSPCPGAGRVAAVVNSGFGGLNAATVIERIAEDTTPRSCSRSERRGSRAAILGYATRIGGETNDAPADLRRLLRGVELEGMDPTTRHLLVATRLALRHAGLDLGRQARERTGLFAAVLGTSPRRIRELEASIDRHGPDRMSASSFVQALVTTPLGASSEALGLRGPVNLLSAGRAGGLLAVVIAAGWLCEHDDVDVIVAGSADEADDDGSWEGGAAVALGRPTPCCMILAGHALAGPERPDAAVERALARAALRLEDIDATWGDPVPRHLGPQHAIELGCAASTGTVALAAAALALERHEVDRALVYVSEPAVAGAAVVLTREETHAT